MYNILQVWPGCLLVFSMWRPMQSIRWEAPCVLGCERLLRLFLFAMTADARFMATRRCQRHPGLSQHLWRCASCFRLLLACDGLCLHAQPRVPSMGT